MVFGNPQWVSKRALSRLTPPLVPQERESGKYDFTTLVSRITTYIYIYIICFSLLVYLFFKLIKVVIIRLISQYPFFFIFFLNQYPSTWKKEGTGGGEH
jgi:hypothetical protein